MSCEDPDTHRQSERIILNVHNFIKILSQKNDLTADLFKNVQTITAEVCGVSQKTVKRVCVKDKKSSEAIKKGLPCKLDDFDSDIVRRTVHEFYEKGEYPTPLTFLNEIKKKLPNYD